MFVLSMEACDGRKALIAISERDVCRRFARPFRVFVPLPAAKEVFER